ncbi:hypothetical protein LR48_Vigan11g068300 [Vigna angularis]|uniref:Uncharacterized protein n=1 Tax=Phaseolus angularis TaxID=3914 RepID=A0A0L9VRF3_PHAAN|nr:hypothetical protein LR48_Vigan11g068300 [Vigna angularis]
MHERHLSRWKVLKSETSTLHLLQLLSRTPQTSLFCNSPFLSPITFQNRRNVRPAVIFLLDRTDFGSELTKWKLLSEPGCRTLLEVEPKPCIWEYTAIQRSVLYLAFVLRSVRSYTERSSISLIPEHGGASLEEALEEEILEDANLVDVEVKAEP